MRSLVGARRIWYCLFMGRAQEALWKLLSQSALVQTKQMESNQPKVWPQFSCWKSMTDSASGEADTLHSSYMLSWQSYCRLLPGVFVLSCLNFPWVFNIIGFKNPLAVQTLMHLYEFTHLDVCTVTDGKTTVDVILHVVRLARQSLRCAKVVLDKKWRWAVLLPQSIGKFDANDTTEVAL